MNREFDCIAKVLQNNLLIVTYCITDLLNYYIPYSPSLPAARFEALLSKKKPFGSEI